MPEENRMGGNPLWFKEAIIYELHVKAFFDSDDDGIGDFRGLTEKLGYLKDLGVTALWLLPFYPSPLKDDGYDIADYFDIHPQYGTMKDFKEFMRQAHGMGMKVITELVLNHTSDQHAWFQKARVSKPRSAARNFYVWSDTPERYKDARIIFQDFEHSNWTWDPVAKAYYWHRFYSHQPDLNFDNPQVRKAMFRVIDFWMRLGVDGVRLDAVPYLYEREGTNCENLPETYEFLRSLRRYVDSRYGDRMLLAEANQWPEDAVAYFGEGDICHMAFHFPLMPRMFMALHMEDNFPILDILDQTPVLPENCQWALFLRNHDELTLEMVTDEERDYMYRMYARDPKARINLGIRRRLAPLLDNDFRKMQLMYTLLFTLPGTPVIYYGNELGMGDNYYLGDRDGVRTPMQWNMDRNAGFSRAGPQQLYLPVVIDPAFDYHTINVETEEKNHSSFLWWMRGLVAMRKRFKAFGRGSLELVYPENRRIFAFVREYGDEKILVAVNLSRHSQVARLDLSKYAGYEPEEMFSRNRFIPVGSAPYVLSFGPHGWYLFRLQEGAGEACTGFGEVLEVEVPHDWTKVLEGSARETLEREILPAYLGGCRWFGGKARRIQEIRILEAIPVQGNDASVMILLMDVQYMEGAPDMYLLPLAFAEGEEAEKILAESRQSVIGRIQAAGRNGILYDGLYKDEFCTNLLSMMARKRRVRALNGELHAYPGKGFRESSRGREYLLKPKVLQTEQSNTSVLYGNDFFLKLYRHPDEGNNPDLEISRFLTEKANFPNAAPFAGGIEYSRGNAQPIIIGILQKYVPNQGDALGYFLEALHRYYEAVLDLGEKNREVPDSPSSLTEIAAGETPSFFEDLMMGVPLERTVLLARRTAELHLALAHDRDDPDFAPEPFSTLWQRSVYQSMQSLVKRVFRLLEKNLPSIQGEAAVEAGELLAMEKTIVERQRAFSKKKLPAMKIRIHGDYHLGQVLFTGKDFVIIDFEGEPARTLSERRLKKSCLRDVAGMIRSFHYAAYLSFFKDSPVRPEDVPLLEPWAELWYRYVSGAYLRAYLEAMADSDLLPKTREEIDTMLNAYLLDKAVYELGYELNNRPEWIMIPVRGIRYLLRGE